MELLPIRQAFGLAFALVVARRWTDSAIFQGAMLALKEISAAVSREDRSGNSMRWS